MEIKEADNLSQLTLFFNKLRKELDFKEELLKIKYKSMVNSYETSLRMDLGFLEKKCKHLCEVIDSYSQEFKTPTKTEPNLSEAFMNDYNLELILLKEKAGTYKLLNKEFTIQAETSLQCPNVECDFRKVKSFIDEINVISHSTSEIPDLERDTLDSLNKEENSSKGSDAGHKTHCSVRIKVGMLEENENSEISSEIGNRSVDITPSQRKH
ncbi:unnamed protein product [Moneuplotes crassus]|uniref:Uncharacterized protein n=1 Tax=Euplotes crassus TaxID=5936 RepID=A0AAD1XZT0_EUPCR|nr:unnamed protein product [Moneuplotes crassus]